MNVRMLIGYKTKTFHLIFQGFICLPFDENASIQSCECTYRTRNLCISILLMRETKNFGSQHQKQKRMKREYSVNLTPTSIRNSCISSVFIQVWMRFVIFRLVSTANHLWKFSSCVVKWATVCYFDWAYIFVLFSLLHAINCTSIASNNT